MTIAEMPENASPRSTQSVIVSSSTKYWTTTMVTMSTGMTPKIVR